MTGATTVVWPAALSDQEAGRLVRYATPETTEALFARMVIMVEGVSDRLALLRLAGRAGIDLDRRGVTVIDMEGAGSLETWLSLLGRQGFDLDLVGMVDDDHQAVWAATLTAAGFGPIYDEAGMASCGFFVAHPDLEGEFVATLGVPAVEAVIKSEGEEGMLATYRQQPANRALAPDASLRGFLQTRGRKVRYAPLLVDALSMSNLPTAMNRILDRA